MAISVAPEISVSKPVKDFIATKDAHERFNIDCDLTKTENHQAEVTTKHSFQGDSRTHVKRGERHGGVSTRLNRSFKSCLEGCAKNFDVQQYHGIADEDVQA
jgi:hypothetical protein